MLKSERIQWRANFRRRKNQRVLLSLRQEVDQNRSRFKLLKTQKLNLQTKRAESLPSPKTQRPRRRVGSLRPQTSPKRILNRSPNLPRARKRRKRRDPSLRLPSNLASRKRRRNPNQPPRNSQNLLILRSLPPKRIFLKNNPSLRLNPPNLLLNLIRRPKKKRANPRKLPRLPSLQLKKSRRRMLGIILRVMRAKILRNLLISKSIIP